MSQREIAERLGILKTTFNEILKREQATAEGASGVLTDDPVPLLSAVVLLTVLSRGSGFAPPNGPRPPPCLGTRKDSR
jgi:hypothetical protein